MGTEVKREVKDSGDAMFQRQARAAAQTAARKAHTQLQVVEWCVFARCPCGPLRYASTVEAFCPTAEA
jgi:hypothetical protein